VKDADVWIGISVDEAERMKDSGLKWYRHVYPLVDMRMTRDRCIEQIRKFGWMVPYKSRCWMCPNQSPAEWKSLKQLNDGDFQKAIELEQQIQAKDQGMFFHPLAIPLS
jgi:hypothetical protein